MKELIEQVKNLQAKLLDLESFLDIEQKKQKVLELEDEMTHSSFWEDQKQAKKVAKEVDQLKEQIEKFEHLEKEISDILTVVMEAIKEKDNSLEKDLNQQLEKIQKEFEQFELITLLAGKYDSHDAIVSIHAGAGGVDAMDWAEMLQVMYLKFTQSRHWKSEIIDISRGEEAGIKSAVFEIQGQYAYGYLKYETGVHRLVRLSPYDADHARHTSFAYVEILPELPQEEVKIDEKDLRIETFKSSGPGGQSVNTTDSAVRIIHEPTKIKVNVQSERSQQQNKDQALKILASRLEQYNLAEAEEERQRLRGELTEAAWGHQIRSYVLHPYKLVKDHRTNYEVRDVENILDGKLNKLIENNLRKLSNSHAEK